MKVGDIIVCKKDRYTGNGGYYNIEGNSYNILGIKKDDIIVSCESNIYHLQVHYSIYDISTVWSFSEHFNTLKTIRKEKLIKIKNESRR
jgi:hypothetical protein